MKSLHVTIEEGVCPGIISDGPPFLVCRYNSKVYLLTRYVYPEDWWYVSISEESGKELCRIFDVWDEELDVLKKESTPNFVSKAVLMYRDSKWNYDAALYWINFFMRYLNDNR